MQNILELLKFTTAETRHYELADGGLISLRLASGYRIACRSGWLSISVPGPRGQPGQDLELYPGKSLIIEGSGLILIEAIGNERLALHTPQTTRSTLSLSRCVIVKVISKGKGINAVTPL